MGRKKSYNYIGKKEKEPTFYYHSDHLGSASYLTDNYGKVTQTLNYLPYGEDWVDLQNFNVMPAENNLEVYKFNGKEKDAESGYNYYGARYYDSEKLSWLSVDPMSDKYPSLSPYVYCADNPVILVDSDGKEIDWYQDKNGTKSAIWQEGNAKTIEINGQTYYNIGANYSYTVGNTTYNYEQKEWKSVSVSVLDREQFQSQFDSRFGNINSQKVACKRACDVMLSNAGVISAGRNDATQQVGREVGTAETHIITPTNNQTNGNRTLFQDVELKCKPIIVGVDRGKHGRGINDGTTDHWIVISGYTYNLTNGTTSYNYFDPGNRNAAQGTSATNVLTRTANGLLINTNSRRTYTVTNIRPNITK